jgi:hypothetical protein
MLRQLPHDERFLPACASIEGSGVGHGGDAMFDAALRRYERRPMNPAHVAAACEAAGATAEMTFGSFT